MAKSTIGTTDLSALRAADAAQADSSTPPAAPHTRLRTMLDTLGHLGATLAEYRARRHDLATVLSMTDLELKDLGINRDEAPRIVLGSGSRDGLS